MVLVYPILHFGATSGPPAVYRRQLRPLNWGNIAIHSLTLSSGEFGLRNLAYTSGFQEFVELRRAPRYVVQRLFQQTTRKVGYTTALQWRVLRSTCCLSMMSPIFG